MGRIYSLMIVALWVAAAAILGGAETASAQTAGGTCTAALNGASASSDLAGNILKCNGTNWLAISGPSNTTVTASGTTGSVQYNSGGLLAGDNNLWWDKTNVRLGIGTNSPASSLQVNGEGRFVSSTPSSGYISIDPGSTTATGYINWNRPDGQRLAYMGYSDGGTNNLTTYLQNTASMIVLGGNVGLGVITPTYSLDINGSERVQTGGQTYYTVQSSNELFTKNSPLYLNSSSTSNTLINPNGGNVGIGTNYAAYPLVISAAADGSHTLNVRGDPATFSLPSTLLGPILQGINTAQNIQVPITLVGLPILLNPTGGNVGIGTTTPGDPLSIYGLSNFGQINIQASSAATEASIGFRSNGDTINQSWVVGKNVAGSSDNSLYFYYGGSGTKLTLTTTGNATLAGTLTQNSDARLKHAITPLPNALEKLALIKGVSFYWNDKGRDPHQQVGVIAQDVQKVYPQLVTDDASGTLSVNYNGLTAPLIEAVKQLKADNDSLRQDNRSLRVMVEADHARALLDHDLLFKMRHHVPLFKDEDTPYTRSALDYHGTAH